MPKKSLTTEVIVTLDETHRSRMSDVAAKLKAKGLRDINLLDSIGAITGRVTAAQVLALREIAGISAVETSGSVEIAPPDSKIQ